MTNVDRIVWGDVESTGIEAYGGEKLLQVAILVTDTDLNILDEDGFEAVVQYTDAEVEEMKKSVIPYVLDMHTKTGLWERLPEGKPLNQVEEEALAYIKRFAPEQHQAWLGGNSITLDRGFIAVNLPRILSHLHYRSVDVTSIGGPANWWYGYSFKKELRHEALSDIRESIAELKEYRRLLFRTPEEVAAILARRA